MSSKIREMFERAERTTGDRYVRLVEDAPEWLREAVYEAHDGESPNDWRYETCAAIVAELDDLDDLDDVDSYMLADGLVDSYNGELARWVADDINRGCVEVEAHLLGTADTVDAFTVIRLAQFQTIEAMVGVLVAAMAENVDGAE